MLDIHPLTGWQRGSALCYNSSNQTGRKLSLDLYYVSLSQTKGKCDESHTLGFITSVQKWHMNTELEHSNPISKKVGWQGSAILWLSRRPGIIVNNLPSTFCVWVCMCVCVSTCECVQVESKNHALNRNVFFFFAQYVINAWKIYITLC